MATCPFYTIHLDTKLAIFKFQVKLWLKIEINCGTKIVQNGGHGEHILLTNCLSHSMQLYLSNLLPGNVHGLVYEYIAL